MQAFIVSHAVAFLLIASWAAAPFVGWWDALDVWVFRALNGSLEGSRWVQVFWAAANHRSVDLLSGSLCALVVIWWLRGAPRDVQYTRCAMLGALAIPVIVIPFVAHEVLEQVFNFERPSPTMIYEDAIRLTKLVPELATKDASRYSFPGDHAFVLFSIIFFYAYFGARKMVVVSVVIAAIFMLPRLVAGAHWLTDNLVGGAAPALLVTAWMMATPLGAMLANLLLPLVRWYLDALPRWLLRPGDGKRNAAG